MSDLNPKPIIITLGDKDYGLLFDLNVMDDIQDKYDIPISKIFELLDDPKQHLKVVRYVLTLLINEAADTEIVTEKQIGRLINPRNIMPTKIKIAEAFSATLPESGDNDPNPQGE